MKPFNMVQLKNGLDTGWVPILSTNLLPTFALPCFYIFYFFAFIGNEVTKNIRWGAAANRVGNWTCVGGAFEPTTFRFKLQDLSRNNTACHLPPCFPTPEFSLVFSTQNYSALDI